MSQMAPNRRCALRAVLPVKKAKRNPFAGAVWDQMVANRELIGLAVPEKSKFERDRLHRPIY